MDLINSIIRAGLIWETAKHSSWLVTGLWSRGPLKDLMDSKLILNESKLIPFRISDGPYSPNQTRNYFCCFLQQTGSSHCYLRPFYRQTAPNFSYSSIKFEEKVQPSRLFQPTGLLETWEYIHKGHWMTSILHCLPMHTHAFLPTF